MVLWAPKNFVTKGYDINVSECHCYFLLIEDFWRHMSTWVMMNIVIIGSVDGLLPIFTKPLPNPMLSSYHGSHRPGKVMEFNPRLEKSLNFMLTWKNGILPGKVIENQWRSLKNVMCHGKVNLNMKTLIIIWLKVSLCHYIWDQIGETMLPDLHSRATCYIVADSWTTCYIVAVKPSQAACAGKASMIKALCLWLSLMGSLWCRRLYLTVKNQINIKQMFFQSTVQICMFDDAVRWAKPIVL